MKRCLQHSELFRFEMEKLQGANEKLIHLKTELWIIYFSGNLPNNIQSLQFL